MWHVNPVEGGVICYWSSGSGQWDSYSMGNEWDSSLLGVRRAEMQSMPYLLLPAACNIFSDEMKYIYK